MVLNVCLIGAGRAGHFHVDSINRTPGIQLIYIVDSSLEKAQALAKLVETDSFQPVCHSDFETVLQEDSRIKMISLGIDMVIVASSTQTHYNITMMALKYNKHVLCEKPLGNVEQIKDCYKLADENKLHLLIGFQKRFDPHYYNFVHQCWQKGPINELIMTTRDYPLPSMEYLKTSHGIVKDMISHDIDMTNVIMKGEKPLSVFAYSHTNDPELKKGDEIEHIVIMMQYASGPIVSLHGSRTSSHGYDQRAEAYTANGLIRMDNVKENTVSCVINKEMIDSPIRNSFLQRYHEAYQFELQYFMNIIAGGIENPISCQDMILTEEICDAINKSLEMKEKMVLQL